MIHLIFITMEHALLGIKCTLDLVGYFSGDQTSGDFTDRSQVSGIALKLLAAQGHTGDGFGPAVVHFD